MIDFGQKLDRFFRCLEKTHVLHEHFLLFCHQKLFTQLVEVIFEFDESFVFFAEGAEAADHKTVEEGKYMGVGIVSNPAQILAFEEGYFEDGLVEVPGGIAVVFEVVADSGELDVGFFLDGLELVIDNFLKHGSKYE